jgi:predicted ATP-grasp superfamily ATP-dependent carboligase
MHRTPVLLTSADFYGTLASVRCFGRAGIPVTIATPDRLAPASWSRYATSRVTCPATDKTEEFVDWLIWFGKRSPRHALLATSDDTAWQFSRYRSELERYFYLNQPSVDAIYGLLNKQRLDEHARQVGLDVPRAWFPRSDEELERCGAEAEFPVLIKPTTQVLFKTRGKGAMVARPDQLADTYRSFGCLPYDASLIAFDSEAVRPMVQEFFPEAAQGIYNISGFVDRGAIVGARAGRKLLQWPRRIGVGVCFEEAPLCPVLLEGLTRLIRRVGFYGVFEAEFIVAGKRSMLIDFNPRFYNQMGFDIARGLPVPLLAYDAAVGDGSLRAALAGLVGAVLPGNRVFAHHGILQLMLLAHRFCGGQSRGEIKAWKQWYERHRNGYTDAVLDDDDPMPARFDLLNRARSYLRYPRGFVRSFVG